MNLITAHAAITRVNQHLETLLVTGPKEVKYPRKDSLYWYHRYDMLITRVFKQYDPDDFRVFGEQAFLNAMTLQPTHLTDHFARELQQKRDREFNERMRATSFR